MVVFFQQNGGCKCHLYIYKATKSLKKQLVRLFDSWNCLMLLIYVYCVLLILLCRLSLISVC